MVPLFLALEHFFALMLSIDTLTFFVVSKMFQRCDAAFAVFARGEYRRKGDSEIDIERKREEERERERERAKYP